MNKYGIFAIPAIIVFSVILTACTGNTGTKDDSAKYFTGYDGVSMKLAQGGYPKTFYYYSNNIREADNWLEFNIQVADTGSADSYGGVYISGYDPGFIDVKDVFVEEKRASPDCDMDGLWSGSANWRAIGWCTFKGVSGYISLGSGTRAIKGFGARHIPFGELIKIISGDNTKFQRFIGAAFEKMTFDFNCDNTEPTSQCSIAVDWDTIFPKNGTSINYYAANGKTAIVYVTTIYADLIKDTFINKRHGKEFMLVGDRQTFPGGQQDFIPFEAKVKNWPRGLVQTEQTFLFTSCYVYTTYADPQVCIDPYPDNSVRKKVCQPKKITYPKGQGAPVAITSIEQVNAPQSIFFTINVQNKGKGLIYRMESLGKCDPLDANRVTVKDLNEVFLGDIRLANDDQQFKCMPLNRRIRLDDKGKGSITCEYPILYHIQSAYQSPLVISLWYGYSETIQAKVLLKRGS